MRTTRSMPLATGKAPSIARLPAKSIPATYDELVRLYSPRPLHDRADLDAALEIADWLAGHVLNPDQTDYLEAVSTFVQAYEARAEKPFATSSISGLDLLRHLLEENDQTGLDLARLLSVDPSVASRILSGQRKLTPADLRILAAHFCVPTDLLVRA